MTGTLDTSYNIIQLPFTTKNGIKYFQSQISHDGFYWISFWVDVDVCILAEPNWQHVPSGNSYVSYGRKIVLLSLE
jgi:hypothetical protein